MATLLVRPAAPGVSSRVKLWTTATLLSGRMYEGAKWAELVLTTWDVVWFHLEPGATCRNCASQTMHR